MGQEKRALNDIYRHEVTPQRNADWTRYCFIKINKNKSSRSQEHDDLPGLLKINHEEVLAQKNIKYLGINFDEHLLLVRETHQTVKKMTPRITLLNYLKRKAQPVQHRQTVHCL